jgi:penicillin-binding protein 1C
MKADCGSPTADRGLGHRARMCWSLIRTPHSALRNALLFLAVVWASWLLLPKPPLLDGISFSQCVRDRNGKLLRVTLTTDQKFRVWTPLPNISAALIDATLRFEDKYYRCHPGVNPVALLRSALNLRGGGTHSGASTITMQLARLRYHLCTRTLGGKCVQIVRALELERHYSKAEILEAYLNLAPYGRNIEGVGAASQIYFDKPASRLSRPEAVALSVIPQSPSRRALFVDRNNRSLDSAQNHWYDRAKIHREFSAREFSARAQRQRKFLAPHFVQQIIATEKGRDEIVTTLDLAKQQLIERRIADYIQTNRGRGIQNAAALLVDARTMDVLAQIGSADFFNAEIQGQVDGTRAPRSPGSTLKPFVYALALQQGLIHPFSILSDAPHSFGDYNPENFDREFVGPIRACDALARSRNLPAVELASQLHHPTLYEFLRGAGVKLPHSESVYGLSLPLGGAEVTMEDLVRLYAALANNGELRPLRRTSRDPAAPRGRSIIMSEAAFLTLEMIDLPRPEVGRAYSDQAAPVFWKTGTSHGFRDAWSIAVFNHYVLAVWVGNFDGRANGTFVGRIAAAPLLFQIIDSLRATWPEPSQPHLPPPGANLKRVSFCAVSGDLPEPYCTQHVEGWFIPGISPIKLCDVHQEVLVDAASGLRVARDDGTRQLRREVYEFWPTELLSIFRRAGVPRKLPPPFLPETDPELVARTGNPPRILVPAAGSTYEVLNSDSSRKQGIPLRAKTDADVREVYWFADKTFIGKSAATDILSWKSAPGRYELTALDDHGRSGSCSVIVR